VKRVLQRERARRDIDEAVDYYRNEGGEAVALRFVADLSSALQRIARHPTIGSPRYAHELDMPGLRAWRLSRYPYLVLYVEREEDIEVWRVLHGEREIPAWLREGG
jgi:toxin ParE1/3/4